jgi:DNA-binding XRE family transcriptional regulator
LTIVNILVMLTSVIILLVIPMNKSVNPVTVGAMVREARQATGISQIELGQRIGASRFWVAQFEKGKPSAELGLALKALHAVGLGLVVEPGKAALLNNRPRKTQPDSSQSRLPSIDLAQIIARSTAGDSSPAPLAPARKAMRSKKTVRKSR